MNESRIIRTPMGMGDQSEGVTGGRERSVVYCLIPSELAGRLHEPLRRHFHEWPDVDVVVERRGQERRQAEERRARQVEVVGDRRRVRSVSGRRVAERRSALVPLNGEAVPELPRRAQRYADQLVFVERIAPSSEAAEDADTARLVTRIQAGQAELFTELYLRYFDRVYGYVRIALRDRHESEDVAQQIFTQVFEALPRYERRAQPFRAWLFRVARNEVIAALRQRVRTELVDPAALDEQRDAAESEPGTEFGGFDWISDRDLTLFVERLPLAQRQAIVLRFALGLSTAETATLLDRSEVDVRTLQHRALRFLEKRLRAIGRAPSRGIERSQWRVRVRQAPVIRRRRFALARPRV